MINVYFVIVTRIRAAALGASVMHLMRLFPIRNRILYYLRLGSLARGFPAGRPIAGPGSLQGPSAVDPTWASARNLAPGAIGPWWDKQGVLPESRVPQAVCRLAVPLTLWGSGSLPPPIKELGERRRLASEMGLSNPLPVPTGGPGGSWTRLAL